MSHPNFLTFLHIRLDFLFFIRYNIKAYINGELSELAEGARLEIV